MSRLLKVPPGQGVTPEAPGGQKPPALHPAQLAEPLALEKVPLLHSLQEASLGPLSKLYCPAGQLKEHRALELAPGGEVPELAQRAQDLAEALAE